MMRHITEGTHLPITLLTIGAIAFAACGGGDRAASRGAACGLAAVVGPTTLLNEFGVPHQTLGEPPSRLPGRLVARFAAGPSRPAIVGRVDSSWMIGVEGTPPPGAKPGFGVL